MMASHPHSPQAGVGMGDVERPKYPCDRALVQYEEIADIGGDHSALMGSSIPEMRFVLSTSHRYPPWGHDLVSFILQNADQHICIHIIIEVESHRGVEKSSAKNPCSSSHARSASFSAQITSQWS